MLNYTESSIFPPSDITKPAKLSNKYSLLCTQLGRRPFIAEGSERSRPAWVIVLFVHCFTYKVRKIQPGYYNLLLHYELHAQGQENRSHF